MATESFKVGDKVQAIFGGPEMTVGGFAAKFIICQWFLTSGEFQEARIAPQLLKPHEETKDHLRD